MYNKAGLNKVKTAGRTSDLPFIIKCASLSTASAKNMKAVIVK
tara:strand:+ start:260 stop:388 length:129 start_codon:yes stop_codon:yes gene_type:complete